MKALDTNVLVRLLVRDDEPQAQRARQLLANAEHDDEVFLVADLVVLELLWVLRSAYSFSRGELLDALELLADLPVLRIQSHDVVRRLVHTGRAGETDLADLLIGLSAASASADSTLTFDRGLSDDALFGPVP